MLKTKGILLDDTIERVAVTRIEQKQGLPCEELGVANMNAWRRCHEEYVRDVMEWCLWIT